ncbi:MAG: hypothetical protein HC774_08345 [Sphingomonadales bacterium]|nr:hypothetical protein [Sphingomonadales bacterium]
MNQAVHTTLTVSNVFTRSATELEGCVATLRDIESRLLPVVVHAVSHDESGTINQALQDIDLLVQTLEDMAVLMAGLATTDGARGQLQAHATLSKMQLFDLRQRIAGATTASINPADRVSFF